MAGAGAYLSKEDSYYSISGGRGEDGKIPAGEGPTQVSETFSTEPGTLFQSYYNQNPDDMFNVPLPQGVTGIDADGNELMKHPAPRKATQSIFNRYSLFYFNNFTLGPDPEPYLDRPDRLKDMWSPTTVKYPGTSASGTGASAVPATDPIEVTSTFGQGQGIKSVLENPTARNIINWCDGQGIGDPRVGTNVVEYAWEDFMWCKNYGLVPNNYMVTLRRFPQPAPDDLWDPFKIPVPDIARLITWVDGEANTWESVGLKFSSKMVWKELESEVQTLSGGGGGGAGCFVEGTLVTMADGTYKKIEDIEIGDEVLSYNFDTEEIEIKSVTNLLTFKRQEIIHIQFDNEDEILSTDDHPYFVLNKGWCSYNPKNSKNYGIDSIGQLEEGDTLIGDRGEEIQIRKIERLVSKKITVRTFEVEDNHNYFANGVLVHNKGMGNEGAAIGGALGNIIKAASWITQKPPGSSPQALTSSGGGGGGGGGGDDPYANKNVVYGPLDVIKKMMMRDKGLEFEQAITLKFDYELRSIDGVNPKVAMIDLLSNVFVLTANRGEFWGGDIRFFGGGGGGGGNASKTVGPLGDPKKLLAGDYSGYFKSLSDGIKKRADQFTGGQGLTLEGLANAAKGLAGNMISNMIGGALDNSPGGGGGAGAQAVNSLLTGEDTGEWHIMVGNPARPIMSIGNLILEKSEYYLHGPLSTDDFPTRLTVTCTLKPARMRDRSDMMAMFHRGGRTYVTLSPSDTDNGSYGNKGKAKKGKMKKSRYSKSSAQAKQAHAVSPEDVGDVVNVLAERFPNHKNIPGILQSAAQGIY